MLIANRGLTPEDLDCALEPPPRVLYVGGYLILPGLEAEALAERFERARMAGTLTVLDVCTPGPDDYVRHLRPILPHTDVFLPNTDEATLILGERDPLRQALAFRDLGARRVVITRGEPHVFYSDRRAKPLRIMDLDRASSRFGIIRHGSRAKPLSTMICGNFTVARPLFGSVLELLPPVLVLKPTADGGWLEAILRRMVSESALERPGQRVAAVRLPAHEHYRTQTPERPADGAEHWRLSDGSVARSRAGA